MSKIIPIRDLRDTNKISNMVKEEAEPIYVTKNGYDDMVIMSAEVYEEYFAIQDLKLKLQKSEQQIADGHFFTAEESLRDLRKVLDDVIEFNENKKKSDV